MKDTQEIIAKLRNDNGLTQQDLADRLFVSRSLVAMWEAGTRVPDGCSVSGMAKLFGVAESDIIGDKGYAYASPAELGIIDAETEEMASDVSSENREAHELETALLDFLSKQNSKDNVIFTGRYSFMKTVKTIANELNMTEPAVRMRLSRLRRKLRQFLKEHKNGKR